MKELRRYWLSAWAVLRRGGEGAEPMLSKPHSILSGNFRTLTIGHRCTGGPYKYSGLEICQYDAASQQLAKQHAENRYSFLNAVTIGTVAAWMAGANPAMIPTKPDTVAPNRIWSADGRNAIVAPSAPIVKPPIQRATEAMTFPRTPPTVHSSVLSRMTSRIVRNGRTPNVCNTAYSLMRSCTLITVVVAASESTSPTQA